LYHAACATGISPPSLIRSAAIVTIENSPNNAGVVRATALF
jgi:hypothetical protein